MKIFAILHTSIGNWSLICQHEAIHIDFSTSANWKFVMQNEEIIVNKISLDGKKRTFSQNKKAILGNFRRLSTCRKQGRIQGRV